MELRLVRDFELSSATAGLLSDVQQLADKVNQFRPMTSDLVSAVHQRLFSERVYSSNAIEGNTLTLRETVEVLTTGHIGRRKREGTEARNLGRAVEHLENILLKAETPHTVSSLLEIHGILLADLDDQAGQFRSDRRIITGAKHQPPRSELIPPLVDVALNELAIAKEINPTVLASWAHWAIARIHPFVDGNGRIARLWQDLVLLRANLAPAIIRLQDRDQNGYYDSLAAADDGDLNPLVQLIAQRTASTLEQYIDAQQQTTELTSWAEKIAGEASKRVAEFRRTMYLRWSRQMETLRNGFERCVARMTSSGIEIQFRQYPLIDEVKWENIRSGVSVQRTWYFILHFRHNNLDHSYIFFFGKHFWQPNDTENDRSEPRVGLLISEQIGRGDLVLMYDQPDNSITLREIFTVENEIVAIKRTEGSKFPSMIDASIPEDTLVDAGEPRELHFEYERGADGVKIAQEFIEHVLLRRMT